MVLSSQESELGGGIVMHLTASRRVTRHWLERGDGCVWLVLATFYAIRDPLACVQ